MNHDEYTREKNLLLEDKKKVEEELRNLEKNRKKTLFPYALGAKIKIKPIKKLPVKYYESELLPENIYEVCVEDIYLPPTGRYVRIYLRIKVIKSMKSKTHYIYGVFNANYLEVINDD